MDKKYGLQLRVKPDTKKPKPPLPHPAAFRPVDDDDDEDNNVERDIIRQAHKNKFSKKAALEEDPLAFDYDGVYDQMKQPISHDKQEKKPKYIAKLIEKANRRKQEQEIVYEKKLENERTQDEHLYADKEKFITSAHKKKLAKRAKWFEDESLRALQEQKDDVTKKKDMSDFYFGIQSNVAFGGGNKREADSRNQEDNAIDKPPTTEELSNNNNNNHHKRNRDALAEARERFLARKKAKTGRENS